MTIYGDEEHEAAVNKLMQDCSYIVLYEQTAVVGADIPYLVGLIYPSSKKTHTATRSGYTFEFAESLEIAYKYFWSLPNDTKFQLVYSPKADEQYTHPDYYTIESVSIKDVVDAMCTMILVLVRV